MNAALRVARKTSGRAKDASESGSSASVKFATRTGTRYCHAASGHAAAAPISRHASRSTAPTATTGRSAAGTFSAGRFVQKSASPHASRLSK